MEPGAMPSSRRTSWSASHIISRSADGLTAQYLTSPAEPLRVLLDLADLYPPAALSEAFRLAKEHNRYSHVFVRGLLEYGVQPATAQASPLEFRSALPDSTVHADLSRYQQILELGR